MFRSHNHHSCPSFLVAALIFSVFTLTGIVSAAWVDAPNAPPNYGTPGCSPKPCEEEDFRPMNLSSTMQTKQGNIAASGFFDTQDPAHMYAVDPASAIFSLNLAGHAVINATTTDLGAQLVVNNPRADAKFGSTGDAIYAYANSADAAISAEQADPAGYAIYASGGINYFGGSVGVGTQTPSAKLDVQGNALISGNVGIGTVNPTDPLHVQGIGTEGIRLSGNAPTLWLEDTDVGGKTYAWINSAISNGNLGLWDATVSDYRIYMQSDGDVGIGTTSPDGKLHVADSGVAATDGNLVVDGVVVSGVRAYANKLTNDGNVCIDDRPGILYERNGDVARVYAIGANPSGVWFGNCAADPGFWNTNSAKTLFLEWNWLNTRDPLVHIEEGRWNDNIVCGYSGCGPAGPPFLEVHTALDVTRSTLNDTRALGPRIYTGSGSATVPVRMQATWSKPVAPAVAPNYSFSR